MGPGILQCPVDAFIADYSPFLPNNTLVDAAIQSLAHQELLVTDRAKPLCWKGFEDRPSSGATESKVLKTLGNIAATLNDELGQLDGRQRHFFYHDFRCDEMKYEFPGSNCRVDTCFTGNPGHARSKWHVICAETAVVAELRKSTKDFADNHEKLVSAANHVMNDDPCRMWMYDHNREYRDGCLDIRTVIQVFLSFTYATHEQMGYDPTVHRIKDNESQYLYEIPTENGTRYFKTIHLLAHHKSLCITGKKTRVWKAVEVKGFESNAISEELNGGKEVALKDVWLDEGSTTEKEKLDAIFESLRMIKEEAYEWAPSWLRSRLKVAFEDGSYRSYFMEIECDSFNLSKSKKKSDQAAPAPKILQFRDFSGCNRNVTPNDANTRLYAVKRQYRLVYSEIGESMKHVKSLDVAFSAILDTYVALVLMYLAGWMHRDISAGNIITVKKSSRLFGGKLSDLEYAKHYRDKSGSPDPKTGTPFFMPVEIHGGVAFSRMGSLQLEAPDNIDPLRGPDVAQNVFKNTGPLFKGKSPRYRFQHDLESLWWVALWILIYRVVHPAGQGISGLIFTHTSAPSLARRHMFEGKRVGETLEQNLHPSLSIPDIQTPMEAIQRLLIDSYQGEDVLEPRALHIIYSTFFRFLAILIGAARFAKGVELRSDVVVESNKRPLSEAAAASKDRDSDEYEPDEEEPSSDHVVRKKKRKAQT
ncbi:hypothetical protein Agabi119p4_5248 [Agaricus bisporus var. burnettii]|uniref:Fungal-type protein kinase domain-containing protein n=1 Tax=Agaricus bisporus var. burnettii TaxID=192524 RepID=A0A8H7F4S5_AGABI|nr:hypothetical protein Agabi119p4_5248 [Agaricus bisporus var. burnettii]